LTLIQAITYIKSFSLILTTSTYHSRCSVLLLHQMTVNDTHTHAHARNW